MFKTFVVLLFAGRLVCSEDSLELTDEEYYQLPALFEVQDYERCLSQRENVFCAGTFELTSSEPSPLYDVLKKFSANKREHFNHTRIHRAVCLEPKHNRSVVKDSVVQSFEECIDQNMFEEYGLRAHLMRFYFCRRSGEKLKVDGVDVAFCAYLAIVVVLNIIGTIYDCLLKESNAKGNRWLMAFSLVDNWKRLTTRSEDIDPRLHNFSCLNGLKTLSMFCVVMVHTVMMILASFPTNPRLLEQLNQAPAWKYTSYHGNIIIQSFVLVANFLTAYKMLVSSEKYSMKLSLLPKLTIGRIVRIHPMHLTSLAAAATIFVHLNDGPLWYKNVGSETTRCRELWWHRVFFMHNSMYWADCMPQTWYLALDFQLYVACCFIMLWIISRGLDPEYVLKRLLAASLLMLFAIVYFFELLPQLLTVTPENLLNLFAEESSHVYLFQSAWGNLPAAILGLLLASTYYRLEREEIDLTKSRIFVVLNHLSLPLLFLWYFMIYLFMDIESRLTISLFATVEKIGSPVIILIALVGCFYKVKGPVAAVLCWPGWLVPSRLSLGILVMHVMVNASITFPRMYNTVSYTQMIADTVTVSVMTLLLALPLALMVEYPAVQLYKAIIGTSSEDNKKSVTNGKNKHS